MSPGGRRAALVGGGIALACLAIVLLVLVYTSANQADLSAFWQLVVAVVALPFSVAAVVQGRRTSSTTTQSLRNLTNLVASAVNDQARLAAQERGLTPGATISVFWRATTNRAQAVRTASTTSTTNDLLEHSHQTNSGMSTIGTVEQFYDKVVNKQGSAKICVIGVAGAGKTCAAIILILSALEQRIGPRGRDDHFEPVPVLLVPRDWSGDEDLISWLTRLIQATYPGMPGGWQGARSIERLLLDGWITIVLDGLDEVPPANRNDLFRALNQQISFRMILFYRGAHDAASGHQTEPLLDEAVAYELQPLQPSSVAAYLRQVQAAPLPPHWRSVVDTVDRQPQGALANVLSLPLYLTLLRDNFRTNDEGLGTLLSACSTSDSQTTEERLKEKLIDQLLPTAYVGRDREVIVTSTKSSKRQGEAQKAIATLRLIAERLSSSETRRPDIAWWTIPTWVSPYPRAFIVALLAGTTSAVADLLLLGVGSTSYAPILFGGVVALGAFVGNTATSRSRRAEPLSSRWISLGRMRISIFLLCAAVGFLVEGGLLRKSAFETESITGGLIVGAVLGLFLVAAAWTSSLRRTRGNLSQDRGGTYAALSGLLLGAMLVPFAVFLGPNGLVFVLPGIAAVVLFVGLRFAYPSVTPDQGAPFTPSALWRRNRWRSVVLWLFLALPTGLLGVLPLPQPVPMGFLLLAGLLLGVTFPDSWATTIASWQLSVSMRSRVSIFSFLEKAHARAVLRTSGPFYQFRHDNLRVRLLQPTRPEPPSELDELQRQSSAAAAKAAVRYLERIRPDSKPPAWDKLIVAIEAEPESDFAVQLCTIEALGLVRDAIESPTCIAELSSVANDPSTPHRASRYVVQTLTSHVVARAAAHEPMHIARPSFSMPLNRALSIVQSGEGDARPSQSLAFPLGRLAANTSLLERLGLVSVLAAACGTFAFSISYRSLAFSGFAFEVGAASFFGSILGGLLLRRTRDSLPLVSQCRPAPPRYRTVLLLVGLAMIAFLVTPDLVQFVPTVPLLVAGFGLMIGLAMWGVMRLVAKAVRRARRVEVSLPPKVPSAALALSVGFVAADILLLYNPSWGFYLGAFLFYPALFVLLAETRRSRRNSRSIDDLPRGSPSPRFVIGWVLLAIFLIGYGTRAVARLFIVFHPFGLFPILGTLIAASAVTAAAIYVMPPHLLLRIAFIQSAIHHGTPLSIDRFLSYGLQTGVFTTRGKYIELRNEFIGEEVRTGVLQEPKTERPTERSA